MVGTRRSVALAASTFLVLASATVGSPPAVASTPSSHSLNTVEMDVSAPDAGVVPDARPVEVKQPAVTDLNHATWGLIPNSGSGQDGMISLHTVYPNLGIGT